MSDLLAHLNRKLAQISTDAWTQRTTPVVRLSDGFAADADSGALSGHLDVLLETKDGALALLHREDFTGAATTDDVDDRLAEALSQVLARHTSWPR